MTVPLEKNKLHIVSLQNPFPPDYGGVIDIYYRVKALHEAGIYIVLHTFTYGNRSINRINEAKLSTIADEVYYYDRMTGWKSQFSHIPYIVFSRRNHKLFENLTKDSAPIIFEGLHTTYYINHPALKNRLKIVRAHNIEHEYYQKLSESASGLLNKLYYRIESFKLRFYEKSLITANLIVALNEKEAIYFKKKYPQTDVIVCPVFFDESPLPVNATGSYVLYHGNLSVEENIYAARWIIQNIASKMPDLKFIIAGKNPPKSLSDFCNNHQNVELITSPSSEKMNELIDKAKVHILITFQATGVKLKLINILHRKGCVIANRKMVEGSGLESLCQVSDKPDEIINLIRTAYSLNKISSGLPERYSSRHKITHLLKYVFPAKSSLDSDLT